MKCPRIRITLRTNIILMKILLTNAHHKHLTTLPHTTRINAASVGANPLPVLGKSAIAAKNQSVKSAINAANLNVAVNVKAVKDIVVVKDIVNLNDTASQIASQIASQNVKLIVSTNAKRNIANALKLKKLFTTTVENALS